MKPKHVLLKLWPYVGPGEALQELWATLVDCWECADVRGHLAAWAAPPSPSITVQVTTTDLCANQGSGSLTTAGQ